MILRHGLSLWHRLKLNDIIGVMSAEKKSGSDEEKKSGFWAKLEGNIYKMVAVGVSVAAVAMLVFA